MLVFHHWAFLAAGLVAALTISMEGASCQAAMVWPGRVLRLEEVIQRRSRQHQKQALEVSNGKKAAAAAGEELVQTGGNKFEASSAPTPQTAAPYSTELQERDKARQMKKKKLKRRKKPTELLDEQIRQPHPTNASRLDLGFCIVKGVNYADGEKVPGEHPCDRCTCNGIHRQLACYWEQCAGAPRKDCVPLYQQGRCCPNYACRANLDEWQAKERRSLFQQEQDDIDSSL